MSCQRALYSERKAARRTLERDEAAVNQYQDNVMVLMEGMK